jgi:AP-4 complex subunit mu-1
LNEYPKYFLQQVIKDFCGVLNEEAMRKNFTLIYEIIDEAIDAGYPQLVSSELIKPFIVNSPVVLTVPKTPSIFNPSFFSHNTLPSTAPSKSIQNSKNNEIFVDVLEKVTVLFNQHGYIINSSIDGSIVMKSFLHGNPELRLSFNDDIAFGKGPSTMKSVFIDDCNFHECVDTKGFNETKSLLIAPPDGEFVVMNYRVTSDFQPPFRIYTFLDEISNYKLQLTIKVRASFVETLFAGQLFLKFPVPRNSSSVSWELIKGVVGQSAEYDNQKKLVTWAIKKIQGGEEHTFVCRMTLDNADAGIKRKEVGPVRMQFEIPMYNVSKLKIKALKIADSEKAKVAIMRWVRYVTQANSYICRAA